jgi:hypothetical protein
MTNLTIIAAEALPRFLLPRLSWNAPIRISRTLPQLGASQTHNHRPWQPPVNGLHTSATSARAASHLLRQYGSPFATNPTLRRDFHASAQRQRDHHFDTLKFVERLKSEGFTEEQSVAMMKVLNDVIEERY